MKKIIRDEKIIDEILGRGVENIYPNRAALKKLLLSGKRLRIYCGYDPTAPTLHLGHGITIRKLAKLQTLGHQVIFLFGDFTGQIGDPDKLSVRQPLTHGQVLKNLKGWKQQIKNIIDLQAVEFQFNSRWLSKLKFSDLVSIARHFTVQQMLDRDMFQERLKISRPIYLHEFFYPLMQAYDSVHLKVDLEVGGNDQTFNMLAGRTLVKALAGREKLVLTTKLLSDPSGQKMGKSEGNMISLVDQPEEMYGKIMSWSDAMIISGFEILTDVPETSLKNFQEQLKSAKVNPRDLKMKLAYEVIRLYRGEAAAARAQCSFQRVFQAKQKPFEIVAVKIKIDAGEIGVLDLFSRAGLVKSNSEARRLIKDGALLINDRKVINEAMKVKIPAGGLLLQRGKKIFKRVIL